MIDKSVILFLLISTGGVSYSQKDTLEITSFNDIKEDGCYRVTLEYPEDDRKTIYTGYFGQNNFQGIWKETSIYKNELKDSSTFFFDKNGRIYRVTHFYPNGDYCEERIKSISDSTLTIVRKCFGNQNEELENYEIFYISSDSINGKFDYWNAEQVDRKFLFTESYIYYSDGKKGLLMVITNVYQNGKNAIEISDYYYIKKKTKILLIRHTNYELEYFIDPVYANKILEKYLKHLP